MTTFVAVKLCLYMHHASVRRGVGFLRNFIHHQVIEQQEKIKNKQLNNTHNKAKSTVNCHAHGPICQTTSVIGSATKRSGGKNRCCQDSGKNWLKRAKTTV